MAKQFGVVPPIGTPVTEDDRVDEPSLRRLARYVVDAGVNGILANGTMGGFAFLTDEEQIRAVSIVVSEVNGAVPVMAIVFKPRLFANSSRRTTSRVSPEWESARTTSPETSIPRSPWLASAAWR